MVPADRPDQARRLLLRTAQGRRPDGRGPCRACRRGDRRGASRRPAVPATGRRAGRHREHDRTDDPATMAVCGSGSRPSPGSGCVAARRRPPSRCCGRPPPASTSGWPPTTWPWPRAGCPWWSRARPTPAIRRSRCSPPSRSHADRVNAVMPWLDPDSARLLQQVITQPSHPLRAFWPENGTLPDSVQRRRPRGPAGPAGGQLRRRPCLVPAARCCSARLRFCRPRGAHDHRSRTLGGRLTPWEIIAAARAHLAEQRAADEVFGEETMIAPPSALEPQPGRAAPAAPPSGPPEPPRRAHLGRTDLRTDPNSTPFSAGAAGRGHFGRTDLRTEPDADPDRAPVAVGRRGDGAGTRRAYSARGRGLRDHLPAGRRRRRPAADRAAPAGTVGAEPGWSEGVGGLRAGGAAGRRSVLRAAPDHPDDRPCPFRRWCRRRRDRDGSGRST